MPVRAFRAIDVPIVVGGNVMEGTSRTSASIDRGTVRRADSRGYQGH
jgi:hypothetical protein